MEPPQEAVLSLDNHCLEGELTFGDPFLDSNVEGSNRVAVLDAAGLGSHQHLLLPQPAHLPHQNVGGGKFIQNRHLCLFPRLKTTALRGN